jgi:hypothetical protein
MDRRAIDYHCLDTAKVRAGPCLWCLAGPLGGSGSWQLISFEGLVILAQAGHWSPSQERVEEPIPRRANHGRCRSTFWRLPQNRSQRPRRALCRPSHHGRSLLSWEDAVRPSFRSLLCCVVAVVVPFFCFSRSPPSKSLVHPVGACRDNTFSTRVSLLILSLARSSMSLPRRTVAP